MVGNHLSDLVERLFGGSAESLVMSLVETKHLTPKKLARLQKLIEENRGKEMKILEQMLLTFLLNASWQVSLIVTFAVVCDWLLRGVAARYRHLLWVMTLLACLAMPVLSSVRFARETMARRECDGARQCAPNRNFRES